MEAIATTTFDARLKRIANSVLPDGWRLYEADGQVTFPIFRHEDAIPQGCGCVECLRAGQSLTPSRSAVVYIIGSLAGKPRNYGIEFQNRERETLSDVDIEQRLRSAMTE